jgi:hypothetical protein
VKYPSGEAPIIQYILTSVVKIELDAMQSESTLFFSLQTSCQPPPPTPPNSGQSSNTVEIKIRNQQADQVSRKKYNYMYNSIWLVNTRAGSDKPTRQIYFKAFVLNGAKLTVYYDINEAQINKNVNKVIK